MIQIQQLKLPVSHTGEDLEAKITRLLRINKEEILSYRIAKQSLDARKKEDIRYVYTVEVATANDQKIVNRLHRETIRFFTEKPFPGSAARSFKNPPGNRRMRPGGAFLRLYAGAGRVCPHNFRTWENGGQTQGGCGALLERRQA